MKKGAVNSVPKGEKMLVSFIYLILMLVTFIKGDITTTNINHLLSAIIILLANGIISICSRLDDLKRK